MRQLYGIFVKMEKDQKKLDESNTNNEEKEEART